MMKTKIKYILLATVSLLFSLSFESCSSDSDDNERGGGSGNGTNTAFIIGDKNYGYIPYAYFIDNGMDGKERTCSFMFSNVKLPEGLSGQDVKWTYLAVRLPYDGLTIPVGTFSGSSVDMDFDVNYNLNDNSVELTGWSLNVSVEIKKSGDNYYIDVTASDLYTETDHDVNAKKSPYNVVFHYEGGVNILNK